MRDVRSDRGNYLEIGVGHSWRFVDPGHLGDSARDKKRSWSFLRGSDWGVRKPKPKQRGSVLPILCLGLVLGSFACLAMQSQLMVLFVTVCAGSAEC